MCDADGTCREVSSAIGDPCTRELDCGPGQACRLEIADTDGDGVLGGTCQVAGTGGGTGASCTADVDCRSGTCVLDRCTQVCVGDPDCPPSTACVDAPRVEAPGNPLFGACLPSKGVLSVDVPVSQPYQEIQVAVPSHAMSFAMVARSDDETQLVGAGRVTSPSGALLYATPFSKEEFYENPLRHQPERSISTLLVPNTPAIEIETGVYQIEVGSFVEAGGMGTAIPEVTVYYKVAPATTLDLNLYFLDLSDHPCEQARDLDAASAQASTDMQGFRQELQKLLAEAEIAIGDVTYHDVARPDLDGLRSQDLPRLMRLSDRSDGINVFFTRSIVPIGVQALSGGRPAPPNLPGTAASGVAVSMDTLCYRTWTDLARATAHELGRAMGLYRNREPDGALDPIPDSDDGSENLMHFSEFGGTELSPGQAEVLRLYPGLR